MPMIAKTLPPRRPRGRPRSAETTTAILDSAYALMASAGLAATSIDAVARRCGVSKMTIYKWWPSREALLIDAFLRHAATKLPLPEPGQADAAAVIRSHAVTYLKALRGSFGKVQLAVIAECVARSGTAALFNARYLRIRRKAIVAIIAAGQRDGSVRATAAADELYDAIYGGLLYRQMFGLRPLDPGYATRLVDLLLMPRRRYDGGGSNGRDSRRARRNQAKVSRVTAR